jgi:Zn-dependent protease with chaperone function
MFTAATMTAETLKEFDRKIEQQLRSLDAGAVEMWTKANAARDAENHEEAAKLYAAVYQRVPAFVHALRRQAGEEAELGYRDRSIEHARAAVAAERSSENVAMLALALATVKNGAPDTKDMTEARALASQAERLGPDDSFPLQVQAEIAVAANDLEALRTVAEKLERVAPRDPGTHLLRMSVAASDGSWGEARQALARARSFGMPDKDYLEMSERLEGAVPFYIRWFRPVSIGLGVWAGGFALLLLAGAILSQIALRTARKPPTSATANATGMSAGVRRAYSTVLSLSCIFYYASIPIVLALVIAVGGGLIYATFALGRVPVKLVLVVVVVVIVTVVSMIKSLFIRPKDHDPGVRVNLKEQPRLRALLDEVAKRIGTRAVDNVYLTPGTDVAVMERGKRSKKERCLILGIAALDGLRVRPFKAVLGHEYGHFTNRDTAGGAFALSVRNSLGATAWGLAEGGAAAWYNPAWLFVNGFNRVFLRISEGASRLQEVLADRWAVFAYGADAFEQGLRHVVERGLRFDAHVGATLREVVEAQRPLHNLYTYEPASPTADLTQALNEALNRKSSAYDSHPTPAERFAIARALPVRSRRVEPDDDAPAWSLFSDPIKLQQLMTAQVRENVMANYGVTIPEEK